MPLDLTAINLGGLDQIAPGQGRCFVVEGEEIAVFRPRSGGIFALGHRCPHRQGPLADGIIGEGKVVCPLHGHKFDLSTGKGSEPSECAKAFKAWEENGDIFIHYTKEPAP